MTFLVGEWMMMPLNIPGSSIPDTSLLGSAKPGVIPEKYSI